MFVLGEEFAFDVNEPDDILLNDHTAEEKSDIPLSFCNVVLNTVGFTVTLEVCLSSVKGVVVADVLVFWSVK